MNMADFATAAIDNGWTEAAADRDSFGNYRSASWRNPRQDQIIHAEAVRDPARPNVIKQIVASTTDELGWAATQLGVWTETGVGLAGAVEHLTKQRGPAE